MKVFCLFFFCFEFKEGGDDEKKAGLTAATTTLKVGVVVE